MNNAPANYPGQIIEPIRITQVQTELDHAGHGLETLHNHILVLRGRLGSVLRNQDKLGESSTGKDQPPQPTLVPLAEAMRQRNVALDASNRELEDILGLLDL